jgi:hypothetical protein
VSQKIILNVINDDPEEFKNSQKKVIQNIFHFGESLKDLFLLEKEKNKLKFRMYGFILIARFCDSLLN